MPKQKPISDGLPPQDAGGMPQAEFQAEARRYASDALHRLIELANDENANMPQVSACREILDRAYGKSVEVVNTDGKPNVIQVQWMKRSDGGRDEEGLS